MEIQEILGAVERFLVEPSLIRAAVGGSLLAIAGTQFVKKWWLPKVSDDAHKRYTSVLAFSLGLVGTYYLGGGIFLSIFIGFANPAIYSIGIKIVYNYFPYLETEVSARPTIKYRENDGEKEIGVKMGDDTTIWQKKDD